MAAGDSVVSICNLAMIALGEDLVTSVFPPDNTKRAILLNASYDPARRALLRSHPWGCNKSQAQLAAATVVPKFTYTMAYAVPADYLRIDGLPENRWAIYEEMNLPGVGQCIVTNETAPLNVVYGFDLQDPTKFDALLVKVLALDLAATLAYPIGKGERLKAIQDQERIARLDIARLVGAQENSPKEWDEDVWLNLRR